MDFFHWNQGDSCVGAYLAYLCSELHSTLRAGHLPHSVLSITLHDETDAGSHIQFLTGLDLILITLHRKRTTINAAINTQQKRHDL